MKKVLEYDAIDSLTALELPDRTMMDTFYVQVIVVFPIVQFNILDGNQVAVLDNLCFLNGNIIGTSQTFVDDSGNTWVACWQDNQLTSDQVNQVDQSIIANNGTGSIDLSSVTIG
jgi:hypothetical protein